MMDSPRHRSSTLRPVQHLHITPPSPPRFNSRPKLAPFPQAPRPTSPILPRSSAPSNNTSGGGIRAHLAHLLPRHAAFTVTVTVHQLHNVPLVRGEFGLKWKIKGVTSHSGTGIFDKVKARKAKGKLCESVRQGHNVAESAPKSSDTDNTSLFDASASDAHSVANSGSTHSPSNDHSHAINGSGQGVVRASSIPIPAVIVSANHSSPSPSPVTRSFSVGSSIASTGSVSSISSPLHHANGFSETLFSPPDDEMPHLQQPSKVHYSPAKGMTPFVKLKEHNVIWEKRLKFIIQMSVGRENGELGDCLAKFVVMQRVISGDPDAPRNPRLGAVVLNLAQYVDAGVVTRRYLLRQSKTNATLKLTIHLEHTAGELAYVAPPLPKDEILSGVAGFLESSDVYRTRPRASDLYTHTSSDSSSDDAGKASGSDASSINSDSGTSPSRSQNHVHTHGNGNTSDHPDAHNRRAGGKKHRRPFEIAKLPAINDPRGTEKLIEALFNPVPVTQPNKVTPFTYLVEVDGEGDGDGDSANAAVPVHEDQVRRGVVANVARVEADVDGSLYADSADGSADEANSGIGSDYHSLRSHPSLQGSLRSKLSSRSLASKPGLKCENNDGDTAISTGIRLLAGVAERRTWWQKVLSPPAAV